MRYMDSLIKINNLHDILTFYNVIINRKDLKTLACVSCIYHIKKKLFLKCITYVWF